MKVQKLYTKTALLLALCFASALALSACKSTSEQTTTPEHPQKEHPEHPKATDTQK